MATLGSRVTATGLVLAMIAVGAGVSSSGGFALLVSFAGVLAGSSLIAVGVRMDDGDPTAPTGWPGVLATIVGAPVHCLRRNLALMGLFLVSSAAAASATAAADPVLCFCAFSLLLLGLSVVNVGVLLHGEQEQQLQ